MGTTTALRKEIEKSFVPLAEARGFEVNRKHMPQLLDFRRRRDGVVHVFDIQWDKHGSPRFAVNFGTCPASGLTWNGKHFSADEVAASWLPDAGRLKPGKGATSKNWFRQDRPLLQRLFRNELRPPSEVVAELIALFEELETYWSSKTLGPHMHPTPPALMPAERPARS